MGKNKKISEEARTLLFVFDALEEIQQAGFIKLSGVKMTKEGKLAVNRFEKKGLAPTPDEMIKVLDILIKGE